MKLARNHLASLDPARPMHGLSPLRWKQLFYDATWLLDGFGQAAFRDGWTVSELFGLWWSWDCDVLALKDGWGGIADRLQGSRSLKMTADRAHWRRMFSGERDQFNRTAHLDLKPLWEGL
ncbi:hypothetical protein ASD76_13975 [Altererythrobacter sp. Root672]|nr:hypothetical protein ASD76_13975 [Altererythrobacter sp. Root672]